MPRSSPHSGVSIRSQRPEETINLSGFPGVSGRCCSILDGRRIGQRFTYSQWNEMLWRRLRATRFLPPDASRPEESESRNDTGTSILPLAARLKQSNGYAVLP